MNDETDDARRARALLGALLLARLAEYRLTGPAPLLHLPFGNYLHVPEAGLLLVPHDRAGPVDHDLIAAGMALAACDALVVRAERIGGAPALLVDVGEYDAGQVRWTLNQRLWVDAERQPFLVPSILDLVSSEPCFALRPCVTRLEQAPWRNEASYQCGIGAADLLVAVALDPR